MLFSVLVLRISFVISKVLLNEVVLRAFLNATSLSLNRVENVVENKRFEQRFNPLKYLLRQFVSVCSKLNASLAIQRQIEVARKSRNGRKAVDEELPDFSPILYRPCRLFIAYTFCFLIWEDEKYVA